MKTAIISSKTSTNHLTGDGHPEQPKRVTAITERLKKNKSLIWDKPTSLDPVSYTHLTLPTKRIV